LQTPPWFALENGSGFHQPAATNTRYNLNEESAYVNVQTAGKSHKMGACEKPSQILTFYSTHQALAAERLLKSHGIAQTVVPTPRELSGNCGIALRIAAEDAEVVRALLAEEGIEVERMCPTRRA